LLARRALAAILFEEEHRAFAGAHLAKHSAFHDARRRWRRGRRASSIDSPYRVRRVWTALYGAPTRSQSSAKESRSPLYSTQCVVRLLRAFCVLVSHWTLPG
jgi:hypothetical protein